MLNSFETTTVRKKMSHERKYGRQQWLICLFVKLLILFFFFSCSFSFPQVGEQKKCCIHSVYFLHRVSFACRIPSHSDKLSKKKKHTKHSQPIILPPSVNFLPFCFFYLLYFSCVRACVCVCRLVSKIDPTLKIYLLEKSIDEHRARCVFCFIMTRAASVLFSLDRFCIACVVYMLLVFVIISPQIFFSLSLNLKYPRCPFSRPFLSVTFLFFLWFSSFFIREWEEASVFLSNRKGQIYLNFELERWHLFSIPPKFSSPKYSGISPLLCVYVC